VRGLEPGRRAALLINECQRGLLDPSMAVFPGICAEAARRGIVPRIASLARAFREAEQPVIFIHVVHRADYAGVSINNAAVAAVVKMGGLREGSPQVEAQPQLEVQARDHLVRRYSGMTVFYGNSLDSLLRNLEIGTVVPAGVSTNVAVPGMVLGALDRGFRVVLPEDCIAGTSQQAHEAVLQHQLRPLVTMTTAAEIAALLSMRPA
jgi:nicotinamidase-related amidase